MAIEIKKLDSKTFLFNDQAKPVGYRCVATNDLITLDGIELMTACLFHNKDYKVIIVKEVNGDVIIDGSTPGVTANDVTQQINLITSFNIGSGGGIPIESQYFFVDTAARDAYFVSNPSELIEGVTVAVSTGTGSYYIVQSYLSSVWVDQFTGIRIGDTISPSIMDNTTENYIPIKESGGFEDSPMSYNPTLDRLESTKKLYAPSLLSDPGSIIIGDSIISSGGREINTKSTSTGNTGVFNIQLFDETSFKKSTIFDHNQAVAIVAVQDDEKIVASGVRTTNFIYVTPNDRHSTKLIFRPEGGVIIAPFTMILTLQDIDNEPSYKETINPTSSYLTDLGSGVWELKFVSPLMTDAGYNIYASISDISILGGNGFTGPNHFGDPDNNDFFPWLWVEMIPAVRLDIATEEYVNSEIEAHAHYLGVFADLAALQTAYPTSNQGDTATVTDPSGNLYFWNITAWVDTGTGYYGDMLKAIYDPTSINGDVYSMDNMVETSTKKIFTDAERIHLGTQSGTNTGDITLATDDTTNETLDLSDQELTVNAVTQNTDGAMVASDKLKLDNITGSGSADNWISGLKVTEYDPKNQTVDYEAGVYLINGMQKTIVSNGNYNLENAYGSINHYTGLTNSQHRYVTLYVDIDEVIKSVQGIAAEKKEVPDLPTTPIDSVPIALIEIKVDSSSNPKDIGKKDITDTRNAPAFNTDEFVKVSADDLGSGHLSDKLTNNGNVTFTIENVGGIETIKADASGNSSVYGELYMSSTGNQKISVAEIMVWDTDGVSSGITVSYTNNRMTVLSDGVYKINFTGSAFIKKNETYTFYIYVNGIKAADLGERFSTIDNIIVPVGFSRLLSLSSGDYIEIYGECTSEKEFYLSPGAAFNAVKI